MQRKGVAWLGEKEQMGNGKSEPTRSYWLKLYRDFLSADARRTRAFAEGTDAEIDASIEGVQAAVHAIASLDADGITGMGVKAKIKYLLNDGEPDLDDFGVLADAIRLADLPQQQELSSLEDEGFLTFFRGGSAA